MRHIVEVEELLPRGARQILESLDSEERIALLYQEYSLLLVEYARLIGDTGVNSMSGAGLALKRMMDSYLKHGGKKEDVDTVADTVYYLYQIARILEVLQPLPDKESRVFLKIHLQLAQTLVDDAVAKMPSDYLVISASPVVIVGDEKLMYTFNLNIRSTETGNDYCLTLYAIPDFIHRLDQFSLSVDYTPGKTPGYTANYAFGKWSFHNCD